ncbi:fumarate hydratase [Candidatus Formimonas warabiya]|uniref:Fumarate hydratase n=1 Tax=Formimonas warabiya TaxID=1761012 RepID=A0A3G1KR69_FORW1|nr:fumarate hydratase [Candidatus Formimonas warabiya]ATW24972.1 fumarate hydratase [Candidatus Formimonas warabiya]
MIPVREIIDATRDALVQASTTFRPDQMAAYQAALARETSAKSKWVLEQIIRDAEVGAAKKLALCDDTGIPHVFVRIGEDAEVKGSLFSALSEGVAAGLRDLPARPMAVKGEGWDLLGQSQGMYDDPGMLAPAPFSVLPQKGKELAITVLMLGGGPEIRGKTYRVFHRHQGKSVLEEAAKWAAQEVIQLGCTPAIPCIGTGRTHYEASHLMLQAMAEADFTKQSEAESMVTGIVNETACGSLGLGGDITALAAFVKIGPARASGVRIVSLRLGCCFDPRKATVVLA